MSKEISCGVLIRNNNDEFLICRVTDSNKYSGVYQWSLPKGKKEDNETNEQTAIRELYEETGIILKVEDLIYINKYINKYKDIIVFTTKKSVSININNLSCFTKFYSKFFDDYRLEVDKYIFISEDMVDEYMTTPNANFMLHDLFIRIKKLKEDNILK